MAPSKRERAFFRPRFTPHARRSLAIQILTVLVLGLPPILYVTSFGLAIGAVRTPDFVAADRLSVGPPGADTTGLAVNASQHASPWFACTPHAGNATDPFYFEETCVPRYSQALSVSDCQDLLAGDYANKLCKGIVTAAQLYTAAQVLVFLAFAAAAAHSLLAAVKLGAGPRYYHGVPRRAEEEEQEVAAAAAREVGETEPSLPTTVVNNALGALATLLGLAAAACLILGQLQAYATMVVESSDVAMLGAGQSATRWYMSKGLKNLTGAAYALALIGAFISLSRCGLHE